MTYGYIYAVGFGVGITIAIIMILIFSMKADSIALIGQYTLSNYSSSDNSVKLFLLSKQKLNDSIILQNDNDITEKLLLVRLPY